MRNLAVPVIRIDRKVHVAVCRYIGSPIIDQFLNEGNDVVHRLRYPRRNIGQLRIQTAAHLLIGIDVALRNDSLRRTFFDRLIDDLVIDIREV